MTHREIGRIDGVDRMTITFPITGILKLEHAVVKIIFIEKTKQ